MANLIIKVICSRNVQEEEVFTIAAPTVVPKKPKSMSQKRAFDDCTSERAPLNGRKHARQSRDDGAGGAFPQKEPALVESAVVKEVSTNTVAPLLSSIEADRRLLDSNTQPVAAAVMAVMQAPFGKAPSATAEPPQPQIGKKWSSFIL
jgi:hypothetical protein